MSRSVVSIFLAAALCTAALSSGAAAKARPPQNHGLLLDQPDDGNSYTDSFSGQYWSGGSTST